MLMPFFFSGISTIRNDLQIFMATTQNMPSTAKEGTRKFQNMFTNGRNVVCFALNYILFLYDYISHFMSSKNPHRERVK